MAPRSSTQQSPTRRRSSRFLAKDVKLENRPSTLLLERSDESPTKRRKKTRDSIDSSLKPNDNDELVKDDSNDEESASEDEQQEEEETENAYNFEGKQYSTYMEMVEAKRKRNQDLLAQSGLLELSRSMSTKTNKRAASTNGLAAKKKKSPESSLLTARKSKRLQGVKAEGLYIDDERGGKFLIGGSTRTNARDDDDDDEAAEPAPPTFYRNRINNGSDMTVEQAVETIGDKWFDETTSIPKAKELTRVIFEQPQLDDNIDTTKGEKSRTGKSPKSVLAPIRSLMESDAQEQDETTLTDRVARLSIGGAEVDSEQAENAVAKVTPDRIYGIATHPSPNHLLICAGDKKGFVGIWNATSRQTQSTEPGDSDNLSTENGNNNDDSDKNQVNLFRFHTGSVNSIDWTLDGKSMLTTSYDGTCRLWDADTQTFRQVFAAYNNDSVHADQIGAGIDTGRDFWFQSSCWDHVNGGGNSSFFVSTSIGTVLHVDMRERRKIVWNEDLSEKKINTISLHPNGHSFLSSGLDCTVKLWDLRKFGKASGCRLLPIASYNGTKSINSAYFSPLTGKHVVVTSMNNRIDILGDFHLSADSTTNTKSASATRGRKAPKSKSVSNSSSIQVVKKFPHDNITGRWLSTFMARWHPASDDLFCVGSMQQPRRVHVYSAQEGLVEGIPGLTAVLSRCCFHPSTQELILAGGNSSGRVTYFRERHSTH